MAMDVENAKLLSISLFSLSHFTRDSKSATMVFAWTWKLHGHPKLLNNLLISLENFSPTLVNKAIDNENGARRFPENPENRSFDQLFASDWMVSAFSALYQCQCTLHTVLTHSLSLILSRRVCACDCALVGQEHTCSSIRYLLTEWCLFCCTGKCPWHFTVLVFVCLQLYRVLIYVYVWHIFCQERRWTTLL